MARPKRGFHFEIEDIGVDHGQYFTGRGIAYTSWDAVFVGVGSSAKEALDDACESAAQCGYATALLPRRASSRVPRDIRDQPDDGELAYYMALYVRDTPKMRPQA